MVAPKEQFAGEDELTLDNLLQTPEGGRIMSCIQCGMCAGTCPYGEYMAYPPRQIINMLRSGLIEEVFQSDSLLNCVACYACLAKCPRKIRLTEVLLPLVKERVFEQLPNVPKELQSALQNTLRYGNPMGLSPAKRVEWVKTAGVPIRLLPQDPGPADDDGGLPVGGHHLWVAAPGELVEEEVFYVGVGLHPLHDPVDHPPLGLNLDYGAYGQGLLLLGDPEVELVGRVWPPPGPQYRA